MRNLLDLLEVLVKLVRSLLTHQCSRQASEELRSDFLSPALGLVICVVGCVVMSPLSVMNLAVRDIGCRSGRDLEGCRALVLRVDRNATGFGLIEEVVRDWDEVEAERELLLAACIFSTHHRPWLRTPSLEETLQRVICSWVACDAASWTVGDECERAVF